MGKKRKKKKNNSRKLRLRTTIGFHPIRVRDERADWGPVAQGIYVSQPYHPDW